MNRQFNPQQFNTQFGKVNMEPAYDMQEEPRYVNQPVMTEGIDDSFDPEMDDTIPYVALTEAGRQQQPYQQPYQQPQQGGYQPQQQQLTPDQINQRQYEQQQMAASGQLPYNGTASLDKMDNVLSTLNQLGMKASIDVTDEVGYAINQALTALTEAVRILKAVEHWVPPAKEKLIPRLEASAKPIINALEIYIKAIGQIM